VVVSFEKKPALMNDAAAKELMEEKGE